MFSRWILRLSAGCLSVLRGRVTHGVAMALEREMAAQVLPEQSSGLSSANRERNGRGALISRWKVSTSGTAPHLALTYSSVQRHRYPSGAGKYEFRQNLVFLLVGIYRRMGTSNLFQYVKAGPCRIIFQYDNNSTHSCPP